MSQTSKTILILVILAALVIIIAFAVNGGSDVVEEDEITQVEEEVEEVTEDVEEEIIIMYTDDGFEPAEITIEAGQTVTWIDDSSGRMWVASAVHPTHEDLPEFDQLGQRNTYSFTFEEEGEWNFHNHLSSEHTGTVIVE
ncbi:MAG: cupredoxin domain-containing protein [Candidatus Paceibacterota bacterium]